jgi:hypothetical protein
MELGDPNHALAATLMGKTLDTNRTGGWKGFRARLNGYGKTRPNRGSNPEPSSP